MMTSPDSFDGDSAEVELKEVGVSDHQSDRVEDLEIYIFTCLTVQR